MNWNSIRSRYGTTCAAVAALVSLVWVFEMELLFSGTPALAGARIWLYSSAVLSVFLAFAVGYSASTKLSAPLQAITHVLQQLGAGNISVPSVELSSKDELGELARRVNAVASTTREHVQALDVIAEALLSSSNQMSSVTAQLASSAAEQAAAIAQVTAATEEAKQAGQSSRDGAHQIVAKAERSSAISGEGQASIDASLGETNHIHDRVQAIANAVESLRAKVGEVGEVIATVNGIAEQANLLAVNASIEAAKAGEFGRGFAVVAQEVKGLAAQSKRATTQVRTTLGTIQESIGQIVSSAEAGRSAARSGVEAIERTRGVLERLGTVIAETTDAARSIAVASNEQMIGLEQMAQAMTSINEASTENLRATQEVEETGSGFGALASEVADALTRYQRDRG